MATFENGDEEAVDMPGCEWQGLSRKDFQPHDRETQGRPKGMQREIKGGAKGHKRGGKRGGKGEEDKGGNGKRGAYGCAL